MDSENIISKCQDFLKRSSERYSTTSSRAMTDLKVYSSNFWTDDNVKLYRKGKKRLRLALNNYNVVCNAIASPISSSPWHVHLLEDNGLQDGIDAIEQENDNKSSVIDAFRKAVLVGNGYIVATTVDNGKGPTIAFESAKNISAIALDPHINTVDGSDAEEGAVINYISVKKARRIYGEDVVPMSYPTVQPALSLSTFEQWNVPVNSVAIVSYFVKEDDGNVHFYKICGNKVVEDVVLPLKIIPIVRFAGNEIYENDEINYSGIVEQLFPLELGANIAYSTLIERCGRSTKANFIANIDAIDGLENYYAKADSDEGCLVLWKGDKQPVPLVEQFQTGDLQATISSCRTLMEDVVGVPLTGISPSQPEKTATEVLRQQIAKESNTANYYNNAFTATRTLAKIIIQLLNDGNDLPFTLENGPSVITKQMKQRQEIQALSTIVSENMKPLLAIKFAETLKNELGNEMYSNMVANLPPDIKLIQTEQSDPEAIHVMNQMQQQLSEVMEQLQSLQQENATLTEEKKQLELALSSSKEQMILDYQKHQDDMELKRADMQLKFAEKGMQMENDKTRDEIEIEKQMLELEQQRMKLIGDVLK